jgi:hypothetical protein
MYFLLIFFITIFVAALITIRSDLRFLKQKQFQEVIDHSRVVGVMEFIINKYYILKILK